VPIALHVGDYAGTIHGAERMYVFVPVDTQQFTLHIKGSGAETARLNVYASDESLAGTVQTTPTESRAKLTIEPGANTGAVWSFALLKADEGVLEDAGIKIEGISPFVSLVTEQVFRSARN
jgi:hypothetical protein